MSNRPKKRQRRDEVAVIEPQFDSEQHQVQVVKDAQSADGKEPGGPNRFTKLSGSGPSTTGKSFLELASAAQQDTQPVETQQYQTFVFDPTSAAKKSKRRFTKHSSESAIDTLPYESENSDVELENLVTDPPEHPVTLVQKQTISELPRTPMLGQTKTIDLPMSENKTSATRTPGSAIRKGFGFTTLGDLALSQAFGFTQGDATTTDLMRSDPVFTRPSPLVNQVGPTPNKYFTSSPPKHDEVETQLMELHPISGRSSSLVHTGTNGRESVFNTVAKSSDADPAVVGKARSNPLVIEEDTSDSDADDEISFTERKLRQSPVKVPQTSSKSNEVNLNIQRTPEGSPSRKCPARIIATQNSDRVTDSQCTPYARPRDQSPHSPTQANVQKSQSVYSHLSPNRLARLGENTQAALNTSPPRGPPTLKSSASNSQELMQSSPPPPESTDVNGISQKPSSNGKVAIVDPDRRGDELHEEEIENLETQEQSTESMIDLGLGALSATQITSPGRRSQQITMTDTDIPNLHDQDRRTTGTHAETDRGQSGSNVIVSEYHTAQSRSLASNKQDNTSTKSDDEQSHERTNPRKLSDIAAEPSQTLPDLPEISFSQEQTTGEQDYDQIVQSFHSSASSPVVPRRHKTQTSEPIVHGEEIKLQATAVQAQTFKSNDKGRSNIKSTTSERRDEDSLPVDEVILLPSERQSSPELDLDIGRFRQNARQDVSSTAAMGKSKLVRPMRFLHSTARKRARVAKTAAQNIYEVEETQFDVHSTISPNDSQNVSDKVVRAGVTNVSAEPVNSNPTAGEEVLHASRIFAYYGGQYNACFTATCQKVLQARGGGIQLEVMFDDDSTAVIDADRWVFNLALRAGDIVRVDWPGIRKKNYTVVGLKNRTQVAAGEDKVTTDIYGYQIVCVVARVRESTSSSRPSEAGEIVIEVPIQAVTIPALELHKFEDRKFYPHINTAPSKVATPLLRTDSGRSTPARTLRRSIAASTAPALTERATSPVLVASRTSTSEHGADGLFKNMTFAISMGSEDDDKRQTIAQIIKSNGGRILEHGFESLFMQNNTKSHISGAICVTEPIGNIQLTLQNKDLGFTALLADSHARRPKHMQALALNLPVLHHRWVEDTVSKAAAQPWSKYLLPAGESSLLDNAVRSRMLTPYDPIGRDAGLENVVRSRTIFFAEQSVLFVMGKRMESKRKLFKFLIEAMGPKVLLPVADLNAASKAMRQQTWHWLMVEPDDVKTAEKLFEKEKCWIVDDEYVVQSLILGELAE